MSPEDEKDVDAEDMPFPSADGSRLHRAPEQDTSANAPSGKASKRAAGAKQESPNDTVVGQGSKKDTAVSQSPGEDTARGEAPNPDTRLAQPPKQDTGLSGVTGLGAAPKRDTAVRSPSTGAPQPPPLPAGPRRPGRGGPNPGLAVPVARPKRKGTARAGPSTDQLLADNWAAFRSLPAFDRLSIATTLVAAIAMIFPWRLAGGSEEIGLSVAPFGLLPLLVCAIAVWVRTSNNLRGFRADQLALAQLAGSLVLLGCCALFFYQTIGAGLYTSELGATDLHSVEPEIGCVVCGFSTLGIAAAAAWAFFEERGVK